MKHIDTISHLQHRWGTNTWFWLLVSLPYKEVLILHHVPEFSIKCTEKINTEEWDSRKLINLIGNFPNSCLGNWKREWASHLALDNKETNICSWILLGVRQPSHGASLINRCSCSYPTKTSSSVRKVHSQAIE